MKLEGMLMNSSEKLDSIGLSVSQSNESTNRVQQENIVIEENVQANNESKKSQGIILIMSKEELKIRRELELEIEKDLEEEIKENICHLAFRLHRLYQHQNERITTTARDQKSFANGIRSSQVKNGTTIFSEMNITIRMEGGSKIEIKEIKKGNRKKGRPPRTSVFVYKQGNMNHCTKKFDWEKTLRSSTTIENKKPDQPRMLKRKSCNMDCKSLELGWKS